MSFDSTWQTIRERLAALPDDAVLVTPDSEDVFVIDRVGEEWLVARFREGRERTLPREQFARLAERVDEDGLDLEELPPGVGPYVSVLSLDPGYEVESGRIRRREQGEAEQATFEDVDAGEPAVEGTGGGPGAGEAPESPFVRSRWDVRRPPERVHDDALLLAELIERHGVTDLDALSAEELVDLYVLLSDVQRGADGLRRDVSGELLDEIGPSGRLSGQFGTVSRARRERRFLKDTDEVFAALDEEGVPHEWVLGVDRDKLDVVLATTDVAAADVYDVTEQYYVQKTGVESGAKRSRLQGLKDRLAALEDEEAEALREEIETLEDRIDEVLAAG